MIRRNSSIFAEGKHRSPVRYYCTSHPSYQANRKPTGTCKYCLRLYTIKHGLYTSIAKAALRASRKLGMDVTVSMAFHPSVEFGYKTMSAIEVTISKA